METEETAPAPSRVLGRAIYRSPGLSRVLYSISSISHQYSGTKKSDSAGIEVMVGGVKQQDLVDWDPGQDFNPSPGSIVTIEGPVIVDALGMPLEGVNGRERCLIASFIVGEDGELWLPDISADRA